YGESVQAMVRGMHLLSHVTLQDRRLPVERLRSMLVRVADDMRVLLIILCDRCHVLDALPSLSAGEQRRVCQDALHLFAPAAARLGIYSLKNRLESLAFPIVYPADAERITEQLTLLHRQYGAFLPAASAALRAFLEEQGIMTTVEVREKQPYSIFMKMRAKGMTAVSDVYDLFAFRVIVRSPEECYQVLGHLHRRGHPIPNRFKDYIAFPKPNGYRSLHTTLTQLPCVPPNVFIEVQVRTEEMAHEAEYGIASHWRYKEGGPSAEATRRVQKLLACQPGIFVLTPKGDIVELPDGATPLDFAFQVHSLLGLSFRAARVNGVIASLTHHLENGDVVEVIRHRDPHPSPRWMQYLHTAEARSKLRRFLAERDAALEGTAPVALRLKRGPSGPLQEKGALPFEVLRGLRVLNGNERSESNGRVPRRKAIPVTVGGGVDFPLSYALCCHPEEKRGDVIAGVITRLGRVKIHRQACRMLAHVHSDRRIEAQWDAVVSGVRA
ncbi:bifunctional (p)ppGpp synthetase/guanosine-3',5'-bis(diphosphate) 3'-pyrophosphohydrolase, partial [Candidatus Peregrinibacteria bacterium]|nr:bifunctional (p)ppGpp synthetase/guanosine-3',5'-bis(diphosphate) 3'-pyrophosphohydrolase [Candidatus Peregrinibacteria bacterium]